ncbi:MAG TPA: hypothetical protein VED22_01150 [Nitrososphaerales archaeon]|nr:hypothetical protein [Nitrososphaerales archaeon]
MEGLGKSLTNCEPLWPSFWARCWANFLLLNRLTASQATKMIAMITGLEKS